MQYLLLCCFDEKQWEKIPESQRDGIMRGYGVLLQDLDEAISIAKRIPTIPYGGTVEVRPLRA